MPLRSWPPTSSARPCSPRPPSRISSHPGTIINVSRVYGHRPAPRISFYAASKAALESLTRSWALEVARTVVRVNAVAPGPTHTGALASSGLTSAEVRAISDRAVALLPLGRRGRPEEIARWILHLADPAAAWVTGQVLDVDGVSPWCPNPGGPVTATPAEPRT